MSDNPFRSLADLLASVACQLQDMRYEKMDVYGIGSVPLIPGDRRVVTALLYEAVVQVLQAVEFIWILAGP